MSDFCLLFSSLRQGKHSKVSVVISVLFDLVLPRIFFNPGPYWECNNNIYVLYLITHPDSNCSPVPNPSSVPAVPGDREDNLFMCYDAAKRAPRAAAEWAAGHRAVVHKTHWGYYTWPKKMLVYAEEQPNVSNITGWSLWLRANFC